MSGKSKSNENIQVYVRCRPINARERSIHSNEMIKVESGREVIVRQAIEHRMTKKFTFDRAFGPESKQSDIYQTVVAPLINEVLLGYNCTVFAYGQTGTGKTHTMIGDESPQLCDSYDDSASAMGIIPRALSHLFEELRSMDVEFSMRVSYLELYNEELSDLLSPSEVAQIRIFEDPNKKGSIIVQGLEELPVHNTSEVFKLLAKGHDKRKMASTLMNAQSSRSHTVFSILVHIKENGIDGEELVKIGKLNLVDLAGSENISKAGNEKNGVRTRETVNINQSLLTLGRVITALVERTPHIPYRESKLTRLLQESLGGRTKTSIIATISPGHKDLEETMSTLEYANRAKNIQNKPEVNQKLTKRTVLKEYTEEIDRLRRDLVAARDKNGIFLAQESYDQLQFQLASQQQELTDSINKFKAYKEKLAKTQEAMADIGTQLNEKTDQLEDTQTKLAKTKDTLDRTKRGYLEKKHLISKYKLTEQVLTKQAKQLQTVVETAANDVGQLQDVITRRKDYDQRNEEACKRLDTNMNTHLDTMKSDAEAFSSEFGGLTTAIIQQINEHAEKSKTMCMTSIKKMKNLIDREGEHEDNIEEILKDGSLQMNQTLDKHGQQNRCAADTAGAQKTELSAQLDQFAGQLFQSFAAFQQQNEQMRTLVADAAAILSSHSETVARKERIRADNMIDSMQSNRQIIAESLQSNDQIAVDMSSLLGQLQSLIAKGQSNNCNVRRAEQSLRSSETQIGTECDERLSTIESHAVDMSGKLAAVTAAASAYDGAMNAISAQTTELIGVSRQEEAALFEAVQQMDANFTGQNVSLHGQWQATVSKVGDIARRKKHDSTLGLNVLAANLRVEHDRTDGERARCSELAQSMRTVEGEFNEKLRRDIDHCGARLDTFQKDELQLYKSSGGTPSKRDYGYPRELQATSTPSRIIQDFWRNPSKADLNCSVISLEDGQDGLEVIDENAVLDGRAPRTSVEGTLSGSHFGSAKLLSTPNLMANDLRRMSPMQDISNLNVNQSPEEN